MREIVELDKTKLHEPKEATGDKLTKLHEPKEATANKHKKLEHIGGSVEVRDDRAA